jgi:DNA-binding transcriptional ArsR family regulator
MARTKRKEFDRYSTELADFAKALAHPARIIIMKMLAEHNTCVCGQIVAGLPLAQSTVSQHLHELKKAGLITGETDGPQSCYCINREKLEHFLTLLKTFEQSVHEARACC